MGERLKDFGADLLGLVPEILLFLVILIVGFIVASVLERGTDALLGRLRVNRLFSRNVEKATSRRVGWNIVGVLSKVVYWLVVLFTLYFAFGVFGETNPFFLLIASIVAFLPNLVVGVLLLIIAVAIAGVVRGLIIGALDGLSYGKVLANVVGAVIVGFGLLAALTQIGVATAILIPLYLFFLVTLGGILIVGFGGALAVTLRPLTARLLDAAEDELTNAQVVVADNTANNDLDPGTVDPPVSPVANDPMPPVEAPRGDRRYASGDDVVGPTPDGRYNPNREVK